MELNELLEKVKVVPVKLYRYEVTSIFDCSDALNTWAVDEQKLKKHCFKHNLQFNKVGGSYNEFIFSHKDYSEVMKIGNKVTVNCVLDDDTGEYNYFGIFPAGACLYGCSESDIIQVDLEIVEVLEPGDDEKYNDVELEPGYKIGFLDFEKDTIRGVRRNLLLSLLDIWAKSINEVHQQYRGVMVKVKIHEKQN